MNNRNWFNYFLMLILTILTSACATQGLNAKLRDESGLQRELSVNGTMDDNYIRGKEVNMQGYYYGLTEFDSRKYYAIKIYDIRSECGRNHEATIYLPIVADIPAIVRESISNRSQELGAVAVVFRDTPPPLWPSSEKFKESFPWNGYPNKLVIYFSRGGANLIAHYRFGQEKDDVALTPIKDNLNWECRSKSVYYSMHLLYPFSVVYDVLTFPIQWLLWQAWH